MGWFVEKLNVYIERDECLFFYQTSSPKFVHWVTFKSWY